jgi:hypothetical protein
MIEKLVLISTLLIAQFMLTSCAEFADVLNQPSSQDPYYDTHPGYGRYPQDLGYGGYSTQMNRSDYDWYRRQQINRLEQEQERHRLARESLEEQQRQLQREREQNSYPPPPPLRYQPETCPRGFSPSENKCSPRERKNGCMDIRLPGGLGCVRR